MLTLLCFSVFITWNLLKKLERSTLQSQAVLTIANIQFIFLHQVRVQELFRRSRWQYDSNWETESEEEWRQLILDAINYFGKHPFVAKMHKIHGTRLLTMGRNKEGLQAFKLAYENLCMNASSQWQMLTILIMWGSAQLRLGIPDGESKLNRALEIIRGKNEDLEKKIIERLEQGGKDVCKHGQHCKHLAKEKCKYYHPPGQSLVPRECRWGQHCIHHPKGNCINTHPPGQSFVPWETCKWGDKCYRNRSGQCTFLHK